jgi:uncharacterized membrane protein
VLSFGFLVYYSHRVASSIQNPDMIGAIVDDLYVAAGGAHVAGPGEGTGALPDDEAILRQAETGATISCAKSGYLQHVDHGALVAAAWHRAHTALETLPRSSNGEQEPTRIAPAPHDRAATTNPPDG